MSAIKKDLFNKHVILLWILFIGLIHGLIYVFLMPPWQHYDEPGHFEYAWLIAVRDKIPEKDTYNQHMRRELAASMIENDFFGADQQKPNLLSDSDPIEIGYTQTGDRSLYYQLVAIPLNLISSSDIRLQLTISRLVSLSLDLVTIVAAYGVARTLTKHPHPLHWMLPLTVALLPGFTDLMTAVNNDVAAVAAFSIFSWLSLRMIRDGISWLNFFGVVLTALVCVFTKSTVAAAIPLAILALLFGLLQGRKQIYAWGILGISFIGIMLFAFRWDDTAQWQHVSKQTSGTRVENLESPYGTHAIQLQVSPDQKRSTLIQKIDHQSILDQIRGKKGTTGAWIWADKGEESNVMITLYNAHGEKIGSMHASITEKPRFFSFLTKVPKDLQSLQVLLSARWEDGSEPVNIYVDGVVIAPGDHSDAKDPECLDPDCQQFIWEGLTFSNIIRNGSAENAWPSIHPQITELISEFIPFSDPSFTISALLNLRANQLYFKSVINNLFETFWARFGWGHVRLLGDQSYLILRILTVLAVIGTLVRLVRNRQKMPWPSIAFLLATLVLIWGLAFVRGIPTINFFYNSTYISVARYAYPAVIATALILNLGWLEFSDLALNWFKIPTKFSNAVYIAILIGLDILSILTIYNFYYRS